MISISQQPCVQQPLLSSNASTQTSTTSDKQQNNVSANLASVSVTMEQPHSFFRIQNGSKSPLAEMEEMCCVGACTALAAPISGSVGGTLTGMAISGCCPSVIGLGTGAWLGAAIGAAAGTTALVSVVAAMCMSGTCRN